MSLQQEASSRGFLRGSFASSFKRGAMEGDAYKAKEEGNICTCQEFKICSI